jgi:hypothetical protein
MSESQVPIDGKALVTVFRRYGSAVHYLRRAQWPDGVTLCHRASSTRSGEWFVYAGPVTCKSCLEEAGR